MTPAAVTGTRDESRSALLRVALAAMTWGTIPLFVRAVDANAMVIVFWRVTFAGIVIAAVGLVTGQLKTWRTVPLRRRFAILGMGVLLAVNWTLYLGALQLTNVAVATLLAYCGPVLVALLTPLVAKEPFDRRIVLPLLLSFGGIVAIIGPQDLSLGDGRRLLGAALALASAFTYALLVLNVKRVVAGVPSVVYMTGEYLSAGLVLLPAVLLLPGPSRPIEWGALAALGIVDTAITGLLFISALRRVRADHAAALTYAEPVSSVLFSAAFLHEPITAATAIGGALVVAGGIRVARMEPQQGIETPGIVPEGVE
ncbi:MAG TPA: DMT family transporter [Coriobacteriia bacterium]|nr:DMT family transporter [Coriobacteriia bacterium]